MSGGRRIGALTRLGALGALRLAERARALSDALRRRAEIAVIRRSDAFDADWYRRTNPDVMESGIDPATHFRDFGAIEGRDPSEKTPLRVLASLARGATGNPLAWHELHEAPGLSAQDAAAVRATRASPLFDGHWYLDRNADVAGAGIDPAIHYVRYGWREGRNPGPAFDTDFYLEQLSGEERKTAFPLTHYAEIGAAQGLSAAPVAKPTPPAWPTGPLRAPSDLEGRFRIGVMVHAFYPELAPRIAAALASIPVAFDLFVSTDDEAKRAPIEAAFGSLQRARRVVVKITPNRGRDIAPMVIGFRAELAECDLALHLHTKRSPYGAALDGWLEHCLDCLAHSPLYVDMALRAFDEDPALGVLPAPPFPPIMRYMAWSGMRPRAEAFLRRLGLAPETIDAFPLDFPASSMMWFRPAALEQLFTARLDWTDFPEEAGQTNDTTAHLIERLIFYIAHANGFGWRTARPAFAGDPFALRLLAAPAAPMALPRAETPRVSIIVPVYNQWDWTNACLRSIAEHTDPEATPYEVILGDDGSTDGTTQAEAAFPNLRVVRGESNLGFLGNVNRAAAQARGDYLMLLNNDTQVQPGWLEALLAGFEARPDAAVVGAKLLYPDGSLQEAGGVIWRDGGGLNYGRGDADPSRPEYCYLREVDYVSGAAILVDAAFWRDVGGFDGRFSPAYYEDTDLCFAARAAGRRVYLAPASQIAHFEGKSHGTDLSSGVKRHQAINRQTFVGKWRAALERDDHNGGVLARARERAMNRRVVVVIDWEPPEYDRHAGGRYLWDYLRLLVEEGCALKFLACQISNAHQLAILAELRRMGVEAHAPANYFERVNWRGWLSERLKDIDAVILSRRNVAEAHLEVCRAAGVPTIYLCHDLESLRLRRGAEKDADAAAAENAAAVEAYERALIEAVDMTVTPSALEAEIIRDAFGVDRVIELPVYVLRDSPVRSTPPPPGAELLFVGSMEHAPNPDAMRWFLDSVWPIVTRRRPDAALHVVGRNAPDDLLRRRSERVRFHGAVSEAALAERYAAARVAIAPLRFGAGVKGKVIEAMRYGVPVAGTAVAFEGVKTPRPGRDSAEAFAEEVLAILDMSEEDWRALVAAQDEAAVEGFGVEVCRARLRDALDGVLDAGAEPGGARMAAQ